MRSGTPPTFLKAWTEFFGRMNLPYEILTRACWADRARAD
jgi:hypothetical protein